MSFSRRVIVGLTAIVLGTLITGLVVNALRQSRKVQSQPLNASETLGLLYHIPRRQTPWHLYVHCDRCQLLEIRALILSESDSTVTRNGYRILGSVGSEDDVAFLFERIEIECSQIEDRELKDLARAQAAIYAVGMAARRGSRAGMEAIRRTFRDRGSENGVPGSDVLLRAVIRERELGLCVAYAGVISGQVNLERIVELMCESQAAEHRPVGAVLRQEMLKEIRQSKTAFQAEIHRSVTDEERKMLNDTFRRHRKD